MEEVATHAKDQSKVSIATCEEFEDLGTNEVVVDQTENSKQLPSPETEIENLLADLQVTRDEVLNDDTQNSNGNPNFYIHQHLLVVVVLNETFSHRFVAVQQQCFSKLCSVQPCILPWLSYSMYIL